MPVDGGHSPGSGPGARWTRRRSNHIICGGMAFQQSAAELPEGGGVDRETSKNTKAGPGRDPSGLGLRAAWSPERMEGAGEAWARTQPAPQRTPGTCLPQAAGLLGSQGWGCQTGSFSLCGETPILAAFLGEAVPPLGIHLLPVGAVLSCRARHTHALHSPAVST